MLTPDGIFPNLTKAEKRLEKIEEDKARAELKKIYTDTKTETADRIKGMDRDREILVYDASTYEDLVTFDGLPSYKETERHWINEPYAFVSIIYNEITHQYLYFISEPVLTAFEHELLGRIYNNLRDALMHIDIDFGSMDKEAILYDEYNKILDIYGIKLEPQAFIELACRRRRVFSG